MADSEVRYEHIIPSLEDWPIRQFAVDRDNFIERLIDFTMKRILKSDATISEQLTKTVYLEIKRAKYTPWKVDPPDEKKYWQSLEGELEQIKKEEDPNRHYLLLLRRIVNRYCEEIVGDFNPKTFLFARKFLTAFFKRLFNNGWGRKQKGIWGSKEQLLDKIKVDGYMDEIRNLFNKGTVVFVPTHYSNLDSILVGYGIDQKLCIPAFTYGAGLNLYDYELIAYFIHRLGAYRVDRRKKNPIYLETLKSMACLSLTEGVNHIFFPGGTRSRSGAIEDKLKLGLLNSVVDAQRHCILNNINRKIFVIPVNIGYHTVLEASGLIEQHLKIIGKEKYVRTKGKSSIVRMVFSYLRKLRKFDSEVHLSFGKPMDVLGNYVDLEGNSFDDRGKLISLESYFKSGDVATADSQRESVYTRILADKIIDNFKKENVILSSHLMAYIVFREIQKQYPDFDVFDIFKLSHKDVSIDIAEIKNVLKEILEYVSEAKDIKISQDLNQDVEEIINLGIKKLGVYHKNKVLYKKDKQTLSSKDLKLLYYYHNKLDHYSLPKTKVKTNNVQEVKMNI